MGKNYIESSLKKFLKRKVKITLGVVVTFLITGMVSFGAETEIKQEEHKNHWEWNQVDEAEKYLSQKGNISVGKIDKTNLAGGNTLEVAITDKKLTATISGAIGNSNYEIDLDNTSDETKKHINSGLKVASKTLGENENVYSDVELGYNYASELQADGKNIFISEGVSNNSQEIKPGQIHINKGFINAPGTFAQAAGDNSTNTEISKIYNFGVINGSQLARMYGQAYNYGIVTGQQFFNMNGNIKLYNYGILLKGQEAQNGGGEIFNFAISNHQRISGNTIAYNYGIIDSNFFNITVNSQNTAQLLNGTTEKGKLYNYGSLLGNRIDTEARGQSVQEKVYNAEVYNYGIIQTTVNGTKNNIGQESRVNDGKGNNKIYNFGKIISKKGQSISEVSTSSSFVYNYGIINSTEKGQELLGKEIGTNYTNNKVYNYGTINAGSGIGQYLEKSGEIYNFGIIKNDGTDYAVKVENGEKDKFKAENYGVIDLSSQDNGKAFSGDVINRGFAITKNGAVDNAWTGENKNLGVVLDENLTLAQGSTEANGINKNVIDLSGKTNIVLKDDSISVEDKPLENTDGKTTVFMKNQNAQLTGEKYNNKNILAVVDDSSWDSSKAIIQAKDGTSLDLTNTVVTGYFAGTEGGTVLSTNSDLTLVGDTVISAIKGEKVTEDVYALSLEKGENGKSPMLTFVGNAQINGKINGKEGGISNVASHKFETTGGEIGKLQFRNANKEMLNAAGIKAEDNYTDVTVGSGTEELVIDSLELSFRGTAKDKVNKIVLGENVKVTGNIDGTNSKYHKDDENITGLGADNKIDLTVNNISNIKGNITLGECGDIITVNNNGEYTKVIDGNLGTDTLNVNGNTKKAVSENIFDYKVNSIENINLNGDWRIGKNAEITFKNNSGSSKAVNTNSVNLNVSGKLTAEMNNNKGNGDFTTSLDKITSGNDMTVTAKGGIKYEMGEDFAINSSSFTTNSKFTLGQYEVEKDETTKDIVKEDTKLSASGIFEISQNKDNSVTLRVKSADELGIGSYAPVYEAILAGVGSKQELTDRLNNIETSEGVANLVKGTTEAAKAYYTAGNVVTKNIVDTYLSSVTEFKDKADKGEWIAYGKYINSDTEFDGGSEVKGYDGDIKGTVGMIEYGMTDSTSYGAVFGKGDTKVDINDGGELSGDNYYGGLYFKHRTAEGIDVLGSFGIVKSDLDSKLKNSFEVPEIGTADALVDGTADSKAVSAVLKAKKDYYVAEGLKVQPIVGAALTLITQEEAENKKMGLTISQQDVDVYELITGVNVIKEFALESGKLEVGAGVEYSWANSNQDRDAKYMLNGRELTLEDSEIASSKGKAQFGAEYIHENGVGIDAKYEMMWSDSGDDSRITAGISYRF